MAKKSNRPLPKKSSLKGYELVYPLDRPWGEAALILEQISRTELWQQTHSSFTAWVKALAEQSGYQESNIWRMITAAKFYVGLGGRYGTITLPPLYEISSLVTAEQLELIEKISRVAPNDEIEKLLANAVTGSLTRDRLRLLWRVYRDGDSTKEDTNNKITRDLSPGQLSDFYRVPQKLGNKTSARARTLISLLDADPAWIGVTDPHLYRPIYSPPVNLDYEENGKILHYTPDCLVVLQEKRGGNVSFHIVEMVRVIFSESLNIKIKSKSILDYCDYFWLALDKLPPKDYFSAVPENVGIITVDGNTLIVYRVPTLLPVVGKKTGELAKLLLAEVL